MNCVALSDEYGIVPGNSHCFMQMGEMTLSWLTNEITFCRVSSRSAFGMESLRRRIAKPGGVWLA